MVMLYTEEQCSMNKRHNDAWADIYERFPDIEHEERRALFSELYPDVSPTFIYPERVPSHTHPESKYHRRHIKLPASFDDDVLRLLGDKELTLECSLMKWVPIFELLSEDDIENLLLSQVKIRELADKLKQAPPYDASFEAIPHPEAVSKEEIAIKIAQRADEARHSEAIYVEGEKDGVVGLYRVFPSDLPKELAEVADVLVEFIDETIFLIRETGSAYIERDTLL